MSKRLTDFEQRLTEIMYKHYGSDFAVYKVFMDDLEAELRTLVEEVIGEDEELEFLNNVVERNRNEKKDNRNKLRAEQRAKAKSLLGEVE